MKKLIISAIAAVSLLFGFASCSGDLHDVSLIDLTGYGLRGTLTGWNAADDVPLVDNGNGTYSYTFTSTDATTQFAVLQMGDGTWGTAYRLAQPKSEGDTANVFSEAGDGKSGQSGMEQKVYLGQSADCMSIPDTEGKSVTITVTPGSTYLTVKVEVSGGDVPAAPTAFYLDAYFILGGESIGGTSTWDATVAGLLQNPTLTKSNAYLTYSYDFKAGATDVEFGIAKSDWSSKYTGATFAVGTDTDFVETTKDANSNNKITGLKVGSDYRIFVQTTPEETVSLKVQEICSYKVVFVIENLDEECTSAWLNGSFWGAWKTGWPIASWGSKPADGYTAVAVTGGVADFTGSKFDVTGVAEPGETVSKQLKFVATKDDWATTEYDNANINVDITVDAAGIYKVVIDAESNEAAVTKVE